MQIGSVVWEEFDHIHTYIHTHGIGLSIRVTLNTKPASQVLINIALVFNIRRQVDKLSTIRCSHGLQNEIFIRRRQAAVCKSVMFD